MPQIIPLVVTAITTVTSAVVAAGPLAVAAFNAANIIGAAALANEAFKAVQPQVKSSSTALEWNADPNAPNRFAFGRVGGAGNIIHNATYGPDKMFVGFVGVMSASGPIKSWEAFKADDAFVAFNAAGMAINTDYANEMYLGRQRGRQPEPSYLPSPAGLKNGAAMPRWGASYKLSGKAAYIYTLAENSKRSAFKGKVPTGIHYIEGLYCYDPRFDDTFPGGTGPCRIDDPTTWVYSTNAYIHALNWNIGRWEGEARGFTPARYGVPYASMKVGGIGATPEGIDFSGYVEAANVFDENAWACAAWPDADQSKAAVLDSFLQAGGGIYAERQGKISCLHRAAPRTSVVTITADDTAGTIEYDTTTSLLERINTIRPEYWSEAHGWQMVATDEVTSDVWREEDGQGVAVTRSKGLAYNYVPGSKQARELAALQIAHTREGIRGTAPLRHYLDLEVGDCFTFEVPEAVLNGQKCIVLNVDPDLENDIIHVTFASESDGKYAFAFGQADAPPPAPVLQPTDSTVTPPQPGDWVVIPRLPNEDAVEIPIIDIVGEVGNATATGMRVEWGFEPDPPAPDPLPDGAVWADYVDWHSAGVWPVTATRIPLEGAPPGSQVYVALSYQRGQNWSAREVQGPVTVPGLVAGGLVPGAVDQIIGELNGRVEDAVRDAVEHLDGVISGRDEAEAVAEVVLETILNEQNSLEREASQRIEDLAAEALARGEAFALAIETSQQQVDDYGAMAAMTYATISGMNGGLAATLNEAKSYTNGQVSVAMNTVYTKAQTDSGLASTLQSAKSYTDTYKSEAQLLFSTKTERANGDAAAVIEAKSYTDDYKSEASLTFATQAALSSGMASTLSSSKSYTDGEVATAMSTVYTKAQTDSGLATTLQEAKSHTDAYKTEASLLFSTKAERSNGDASTLQSAKSYTDDYKSQASLTFATQAALSSGLASTLSTAQSYTNGQISTAMNTVYTKAQVDSAQATTLSSSKSYTDAYKAEASSLFATQSSLGGVSSTASLALSTAQDAATKLNEARVSLRAAASGSRPALLQLLSGTLGSSIALSGDEIWFGDNTVFDDASQTFRSVSGSVRTVTLGPFGVNGDLALWVGPNSVAKGSESKANAYVFVATTAPRFGGSDVPSGGGGGIKSGVYSGAVLLPASAAVVDLDGLTANSLLTFSISGSGLGTGGGGGGWEIREQAQTDTSPSAGVVVASGLWTPIVGDGGFDMQITGQYGGAPKLNDRVRTGGNRRYRLVITYPAGPTANVSLYYSVMAAGS